MRNKLTANFIQNIIIFVGTLIVGAMVYKFSSLGAFVNFFKRGDIAFYDFVDTYYQMAVTMRGSQLPIDGYYYSPTFAILLQTLGGFTLAQATWVWMGIIVSLALACLIFCSWLIAKFENRTLGLFYGFITVSSFYSLNNIFWGQLTDLLYFLVIIASYLFYSKRYKTAVAVMICACSIKYFFVIFMLLFLLKKDWKNILKFGTGLIASLFIIPILYYGFDHCLEFYRIIAVNIKHDIPLYAIDPSNQYLSFVILRLNQWLDLSLQAWPFVILILLAFGIVISHEYKQNKLSDWHSIMVVVSALFMMTPLLTPTTWEHYFLYLSLVHCLLISEIIREHSKVLKIIVSIAVAISLISSNVIPLFILERLGLNQWVSPLDQAKYGFPLITNVLMLLSFAVLRLKWVSQTLLKLRAA